MTVGTARRGDERGVCVIRLPSDLSPVYAQELQREVEAALGEAATCIALDMSGVGNFCSAFLGIMIKVGRRVRDVGGVLCVFSAPRHVTRTLRFMGIDEIFPIYANEEEAINSFDE